MGVMLAGPIGKVGVQQCNAALLCSTPAVGVKTGGGFITWIAAVVALECSNMLMLSKDFGMPAAEGTGEGTDVGHVVGGGGRELRGRHGSNGGQQGRVVSIWLVG
jgi:hypothetical protein